MVKAFFTVTVGTLILVSGCSPSKQESTAVARVGSTALSREEFSLLLPQGGSFITDSELQAYLQTWVETELLYLASLDAHFGKDLTLNERVVNFRKKLLGHAFFDAYRSNKISVSNDEIREYYDDHRETFVRQKTEVKLIHFLLASQAEAQDVKRKLLLYDGSVRQALVQKYQVDADVVSPGGLLPPVDSAVFDQKITTGVVGPIRTEFGYHVAEILERFPSNSIRGLDEVYDEVYQRIVQEKSHILYISLIDSLRAEYGVSTNPDLVFE